MCGAVEVPVFIGPCHALPVLLLVMTGPGPPQNGVEVLIGIMGCIEGGVEELIFPPWPQ